jgi:hypothetical protein
MALVVALLAATAVAFALTEGLKLQPSPILGTSVPRKVFSPVCECDSETAEIRFRLRDRDTLDIQIVRDGTLVRTIVPGREFGKGLVAVEWDGLDDRGRLVPDGEYRPRVRLHDAHRTIELPNPIRVDTKPPAILAATLRPPAFSPDGDGRRDKVIVRYRLGEPGRGLFFVGGKRRVVTKFPRERDKLFWEGLVGGKPVRAGVYPAALRAVDPAGNVSPPRPLGRLTVRFVELAADSARAVQGRRFRIRVRTDAATVRWRFAGGHGVATGDVLVLRAPRRPGFYTLFVEANGHGDKARVLVAAR